MSRTIIFSLNQEERLLLSISLKKEIDKLTKTYETFESEFSDLKVNDTCSKIKLRINYMNEILEKIKNVA